MTPQYEKCRSLIAAAVPSIMELGFGCEIIFTKSIGADGDTRNIKAKVLDFRSLHKTVDVLAGQRDNLIQGCYTIFTSEISQILGRPIRLNDVWAAINTKMKNGSVFVPEIKGKINLNPLRDMLEFFWNNWPASDNLADCTPETIEFIIKLLEK